MLSLLQRHPLIRQMRARPRLMVAVLAGVLTGIFIPDAWGLHRVTSLLIAWNVGVGLYVLLAIGMMLNSEQKHINRRAQQQDEGQITILVLVTIAAVASLAAIGGELAVVKDMHGAAKSAHVCLAVLTVLSSWAFIQIMFALHYAHDFYAAKAQGRKPGILFPDDEKEPDYGDFFYFSAVIGTSGQTADVAFVSKMMRRVGSLHCILAYLFNTTVLALLINIGAGLF